jgi:4-hydroxy-tetrahydrodipicolinate reductase
MKLLILGRGKTGTLVAEVARERRHTVETLGGAQNANASALTPQFLAPFDAVIDFTTPESAVANIEVCLNAGKSLVVGTTGWYGELPRLRELATRCGSGLVYGANFSIGVNVFYEVARIASEALKHGYSGQIFERHHKQKKDAPSGTALKMQGMIKEASGTELEITSFREGDVVGMHELVLDSRNDNLYLCHSAKSRRGYAEGAVLAADWLRGRKGFYDFRDIWREL